VIIDTSALVAILRQEDDAEVYAAAILATPTRTISATNDLECAIVLDNRLNPLSGRGFDQFLLESGIAITSVTPELARIARSAYRDFGRGSGPPVRLASATASPTPWPSGATSHCSTKPTTSTTPTCAAPSVSGGAATGRVGSMRR
jgi:ribonuclease VapC